MCEQSPSTSNHGRLVPVGIPPVSDGESGSLNGRRLRRRNSILMNGGNVSPQARKSVWRMGTNKRVRFIGENTEVASFVCVAMAYLLSFCGFFCTLFVS